MKGEVDKQMVRLAREEKIIEKKKVKKKIIIIVFEVPS